MGFNLPQYLRRKHKDPQGAAGMCTAIKQNEEDRLTNGNPPTLNVPLDAYVAVGLFNKKDTSKVVNPRKACGSPFVTNESYICMVTSRHFSKHFFFFMWF